MTTQSFLDLDELILLCRNENAKNYIQDAVQCYRAGAFRQAIVATWIAVVYDIVNKLQELELTGDPNATKYLEQYEKIRKAGDLRGSLEFEKSILKIAKEDFELITDIEYVDLVRLQEDRNRCAHPAMNSDDEIYLPSPELARTHLRNAIEHLLQRQPVQGKAALKRLETDVESDYFPTNIDDAIKHFSAGPLARPKPSLVRNFVIVLMKSLLASSLDIRKRSGYLAALQAVIQLHRGISLATMAGKLNDIVVQLQDQDLLLALIFVGNIQDTWQFLKGDSVGRLKNFVRNLPVQIELSGLLLAFNFADLHEDTVIRLNSISLQSLIPLSRLRTVDGKSVSPEVVEKAVDFYIGSGSFATANEIGTQLIVPIAEFLLPKHIEQIIQACEENIQIRGSFQMNTVLRAIRDCEIIPVPQYNDLLIHHGLGNIDPQETPASG